MPEITKRPEKKKREDHSDLLITPKNFAKISVHNIQLADGFHGTRDYVGNAWLELSGDFGSFDRWNPLLAWDLNPAKYAGRPVRLWPEFRVEGNIRLELRVRLGEWNHGGSFVTEQRYPVGSDRRMLYFNEEETDGYLSMALFAAGEGTLRIGTLHCRQESTPYGTIVDQDDRFADTWGGEVFSYFNLGNAEPPLVVHFCDFSKVENFRDAMLFEYFNVPYLIFTDARVFDGCFYIGAPEYEQYIMQAIQKAKNYLQIRGDKMLFSGYGMGAYAATHYGIPFRPDTIMMAQPVMNITKCAEYERTIRPGRFPGSMDILKYLEMVPKKTTPEEINGRIWKEIDAANLRRTNFAIAYMKEDDYDPTAYSDLVDHLATKNTMIYGKGITGRHGDDMKSVRNWYYNQFRQILKDEFFRSEA